MISKLLIALLAAVSLSDCVSTTGGLGNLTSSPARKRAR